MAHAMLSEHPDAGICLTDTVEVFPDGKQRPFSYHLSREPSYFPRAEAPAAIRALPLVPQGFLHLDGLRLIGGYPQTFAGTRTTSPARCWRCATDFVTSPKPGRPRQAADVLFVARSGRSQAA